MRLLGFYFSMQITPKPRRAAGSVRGGVCTPGSSGLGLSPESGRSPGEGNGSALQYSCLENLMDREAWQAIVHGVARVRHDLAIKPPPPIVMHL